MSVDAVALERERYHQAQQKAALRARDERLAMTEGKGDLLLQLHPALYDDRLTHLQVTSYLGITYSTLRALVRIHRDELQLAGYKPAAEAAAARFSRRAVLHLAMLLRPNASEQAVRIKKALGVYVPTQASRNQRWAGHVTACKHLLAKAAETAEAVQDVDPQEVWADLCQLDRWQLQALVVALSAMVPIDKEGVFAYLASVGDAVEVADRTERADYGKKGHVARGLAQLIPATRSEYEATSL